ncbi:methionyl-tRNA formyltransferase [Cryomorpha ignava]|uniref:Methionyl-tRNA formyltransferase n=2 Tax=Cryomorpha ignava TaxID=101383 RepID=A0A7K3WXI2_9FLAO|nr:methionyl-tRNA formyltransferase [Cryomorpha ignava]
MGTPEFAVPSLKTLAEAHQVVGVITAPDKPAGRGKKILKSAVKEVAEELGLHVLQPTNLKNPEFLKELESLEADLFVVLAFRMLPESVWSMPARGTINLHASLLPDYRGAAPINRAIMNGESKTGLTTFFIEKEIDTGMIIDQVEMLIGAEEDAGMLHDRMMDKGAELLLSTVNKIEKKEVKPIPQKPAGELKQAPKIFKEDCEIDWSHSTAEVHHHIRGLSPYPTAWTIAAGVDFPEQSFKIYQSRIAEFKIAGQHGSILLTDELRLFVKCDDGALEIIELQVPGKKRMKTTDFLRGFRSPIDFRFHK